MFKTLRTLTGILMTIIPTTPDDLGTLAELFDQAIRFQRSKYYNYWLGMNKPLIEKEINERLHWKVMEGDRIACFFSIAFTDPLVWDKRDVEPSIYLHRIVTNPVFRGRGYVKDITAWAGAFGAETGKQFIRLDTHVANKRLNSYYRECGYTFCGVKIFKDQDPVPKHYLGEGLSLYEKQI
jgi:ribosomal protein S18 acetylase RimI-like enzyme